MCPEKGWDPTVDWVIVGIVVGLLIAWRRSRRRRQEVLADVELYRGPRWGVRGGSGYWWFGR